MIDQHRDGMNAIVINLARRSQLLVEQQLRLLEEMERDERDPERLSALFRVDHLAARLRRNDENLLVLAGGQPRRRVGAGLSLDGMVLAALSEVEQYHRVRTEFDVSGEVSGRMANDLIHLLAELLDNATTFSPPDSPVHVTATSWASSTSSASSTSDNGHRGGVAQLGGVAQPDGVVIEITDEGIGLSPGALAEANASLEHPPELTLAASERMGLVVVSHLAARHQVRVRLTSSHAGTCARVRIPGEHWQSEGGA